MTEHVLSGLTKRRAELAGEAEALRARLAQISTDLGHLDAVIDRVPRRGVAALIPGWSGLVRRPRRAA